MTREQALRDRAMDRQPLYEAMRPDNEAVRRAIVSLRQTRRAEPDERITPLRLLGLVVFCAFLWLVLLYALPVVMTGLAGGAA